MEPGNYEISIWLVDGKIAGICAWQERLVSTRTLTGASRGLS